MNWLKLKLKWCWDKVSWPFKKWYNWSAAGFTKCVKKAAESKGWSTVKEVVKASLWVTINPIMVLAPPAFAFVGGGLMAAGIISALSLPVSYWVAVKIGAIIAGLTFIEPNFLLWRAVVAGMFAEGATWLDEPKDNETPMWVKVLVVACYVITCLSVWAIPFVWI